MSTATAWTEKRLIEIDAATLCRWLAADMAVLVDVREDAEFAEDRIPGAISMPLSGFDPAELPDTGGKRLVLTCAIGRRSAQAAGIMLASGYDQVIQLRGGMLAWDDGDFTTLSGPVAAMDNMPAAGLSLLPCA